MTEEQRSEGSPEPPPASDDTTAVPTPPLADAAPPPAPAYTPPISTPPPAPAQPPMAWAPPPVATAVVGQRTTLSLAAGILLVVLGVIGGLLSLLILTIGREVANQFDFTSLPGVDTQGADVSAIAGSAVVFAGIVLLVFSTFYIVGGVGVLRSKDWGRVIGIIVGILAGLFWLAGVAGADSARGGLGFALILLVIHAYIAIVLLFFWRNRSAA